MKTTRIFLLFCLLFVAAKQRKHIFASAAVIDVTTEGILINSESSQGLKNANGEDNLSNGAQQQALATASTSQPKETGTAAIEIDARSLFEEKIVSTPSTDAPEPSSTQTTVNETNISQETEAILITTTNSPNTLEGSTKDSMICSYDSVVGSDLAVVSLNCVQSSTATTTEQKNIVENIWDLTDQIENQTETGPVEGLADFATEKGQVSDVVSSSCTEETETAPPTTGYEAVFEANRATQIGSFGRSIVSEPALPIDVIVAAVTLGYTSSDAITEPVEATTSEVKDTFDATMESKTVFPLDIATLLYQNTEVTESRQTRTDTDSICTEVGNFSNPANCHTYISCSGNATDLLSQEIECPERYAFSPVFRRCTRDISPCGDNVVTCLETGSQADVLNNSSYYWCTPNLLGGYHKYHIQCTSPEMYNALIGRCWPEDLLYGPVNFLPDDRDAVRAEWKQLKKEIKTKAKEKKNRQKMEAKAKAREEKLAAKQHKKEKELSEDSDDED